MIMMVTLIAPLLCHASTYSENSVLANGKWAKISVANTGICRLTPEVVKKAGFSDISKVKVYGYGGALIPETLTQEWLQEHDDLKEVATCTYGDSKYFYGVGTVTWDDKSSAKRTRNPYANYGCYFITEGGNAPLTCSETDLLNTASQSATSYHFLIEDDAFSYSQLGRNLLSKTEVTNGKPEKYDVVMPAGVKEATIQVAVGSGSVTTYTVTCGNQRKSASPTFPEYHKMKIDTHVFYVDSEMLSEYVGDDGKIHYPVTLACTSTGAVRLDYVSATYDKINEILPLASGGYPAVEYVENVSNQNHHADEAVDLVIIIPTSGELYGEANRLAEFHRNNDGMTVRVVKANELYNEFSSGTPDVSAYRRYLKMFYDRAGEDDSKRIKNVLLFGDAIWDNRVLAVPQGSFSQDRYLLGYQTEDSYTLLSSIIADDFITVLQDEKTIHTGTYRGSVHFDVGVGRIPVTTSDVAANVVNKIIDYSTNSPSGTWQNEIMFIGDDGDNNSHMRNININANAVMYNNPGYNVKKVMLDAYEVKRTSVGERYPEASTHVKKQQNDGALIMDFGGHASWTELSHEKLLTLADFIDFKGKNYSLWFTAACETVPFDQTYNTIGEAALLNAKGGAIAFYGAVRTVSEDRNSFMNLAFNKYVLSYDDDGKPLTLGEAQRRAKNDLVARPYKTIKYISDETGKLTSVSYYDNTINKHHYTLIGDPAMHLALPTSRAVVDLVNGNDANVVQTLQGHNIVTVKGHMENLNNEKNEDFNGTLAVVVRDSEKTIKCRDNQEDADNVFEYKDRTSTLYRGSCEVVNGEYEFTFRVPSDIENNGAKGMITLYAIDNVKKASANGESASFDIQGWENVPNDMQGPSIYAYLNDNTFRNGGVVGRTPFFVAEVADKDGVNATGSSLGHNMMLIIDDDAKQSYNLTENFVFDSGSYTSGQTHFVIPELTPGRHTLEFKAWDLLNNSSVISLDFNVQKALEPNLVDINVWPLFVKDMATFYIKHDMRGSDAELRIEIFSPSGQLEQVLEWNETLSEGTGTMFGGVSERYGTTSYKWIPSGLALGMYLYRVKLSCDGSQYVSKTKKLVIAQ